MTVPAAASASAPSAASEPMDPSVPGAQMMMPRVNPYLVPSLKFK
jgi:hypothetical protein